MYQHHFVLHLLFAARDKISWTPACLSEITQDNLHILSQNFFFIFFISFFTYQRLLGGILFRAYTRGYGFDEKAHQQHTNKRKTKSTFPLM